MAITEDKDYKVGGYVPELDIIGLDVVFSLDPYSITRTFESVNINKDEDTGFFEYPIVILFNSTNETVTLPRTAYNIDMEYGRLTLTHEVNLSKAYKLLLKRPFKEFNVLNNDFESVNKNLQNIYMYINFIINRVLLTAHEEQSRKSLPDLNARDLIMFGTSKRFERINIDEALK